MRRPSAWLIWTGAALAVWIIWGLLIAMTVQRSLSDLAQERDTLKSETAKATALLANAPLVARRLDSLGTSLQKTTQRFYSLEELRQLEAAVQRPANDHDIAETSVELELNSVLDLQQSPPGDIPRIDTVGINVSAHGDFQAIGRWLDDIEQRVDFTQWRGARWENGNKVNMVTFAGIAAFRIAVNRWDAAER